MTLRRRIITRLAGFDYTTPGGYFATLCTVNHLPLFGTVEADEVRLNPFGEVAQRCWLEVPQHFSSVQIDAFVIMPDHIHLILFLGELNAVNDEESVGIQPAVPQEGLSMDGGDDKPVGTWHAMSLQNDTQRQFSKPQRRSLSTVIGSYKSAVTREINRLRATPGAQVWQGRFWEQIIRDEAHLNRLRAYIAGNPARLLLAVTTKNL